MKKKIVRPMGRTIALIVALLFIAVPSFAAEDFFLYGNQGTANITTTNLIEAGGDALHASWFTAVDYFRSGPYKGRMIAATGAKVYMQSAGDPESWTEIGSIANEMDPGYSMDPAFIKVSPDGTKIALGIGYGKPLLVMPSSICENVSAAPLITVRWEDPDDDETQYYELATGVAAFDENYYDAAWAPDNKHLVINGGKWPGPDHGSGVTALNTQTGTVTGLLKNIPGSSASIAVDNNYNLVTGIGYKTTPVNRTGEIKLWKNVEWWNGGSMIGGNYDDQDRIVAANALSSAYLGFDIDGNLCVGGGDAFGVGGPSENGYAAVINHKVIERVAAEVPGLAAPVNEEKGDEYRQFAPDPCQNDTATGIIAFDGGISVSWNPTQAGACTPGSHSDNWEDGIVAKLTTYKLNDTRDQDGDGVPDCEDHSPGTYDQANIDSDGDGYGNVIDADYNNDGIVNMDDYNVFYGTYGTNNADSDMNGDGIVNMDDYNVFFGLYGKVAPYYNMEGN
ncbi:MAG: hypothetical protein HUN04_14900 [Desulfobacter sp.]|nr:MAG: hypothetical protein HUN04_14900 [Desulfobacter sp.]